MSNVKIEFRRDVEVDLNAYFEDFSRPLRKSIEDEMFKLLGGSPRDAKTRQAGNGASVTGLNKHAKLCINPNPPGRRRAVGSKTAVILGHLQRLYQGGVFTPADFDKLMKDNNIEGRSSTWLGNMVRAKYLKVMPA